MSKPVCHSIFTKYEKTWRTGKGSLLLDKDALCSMPTNSQIRIGAGSVCSRLQMLKVESAPILKYPFVKEIESLLYDPCKVVSSRDRLYNNSVVMTVKEAKVFFGKLDHINPLDIKSPGKGGKMDLIKVAK